MLCLVVSGACSALLAQENFGAPEDNNDARVVVSYGSTTAYVDATAELPFYLTAPYEVGAVESELRLPKATIAFDKVRKSDILGGSSSATLETSVTDDPKDAAFSVLRVSVKDSPNKALPTGLLAFITLKVSADAKPGDVKLEHHASARVPTPGAKNIVGVVAESPQISIYPKGINPTLTCFFFSH
jgi:hypothetical protein